jgi:capsular exopolysaccharide synthesis family protein
VTPREFVTIVRERWRFIVAGLLLGIIGATLAIILVPREYSAPVTVIVATQPVDPTIAPPTGSDEVSAQRISTYVELMSSRRLAGDVIAALRLPVTPEQLASRISVTTTPDSALITATVTDDSSTVAVQIANAIGDAFIKNVAEIEQPADPTRRPSVAAKVFQPAQAPADLVAPRPTLYAIFGVVLGLLAGFGAAVVRSALDTRVKSRNQLEEMLGAPVLGIIGRDPKIRSSPLVMYGAPHTQLAEAFRQLRTNVQFTDIDRQRKSILVTSATSGEGRTTTVCNLGLALAEAGARVVIVDADLRNPSIAACLGIEGTPGLTDVLLNAQSLDEAVHPIGPTLDALPSGLCPPNPSELLGSDRMADLLMALRRRYDIVLIDTAPLLPVTDAAVLAPNVDGVLVLARHGQAHVQDVYAARDALHAVSARILGSVLTMVPRVGTRKRSRIKHGPERQPPVARPRPPGDGPSSRRSEDTTTITTLPAQRENPRRQAGAGDMLDRGSAAR